LLVLLGPSAGGTAPQGFRGRLVLAGRFCSLLGSFFLGLGFPDFLLYLLLLPPLLLLVRGEGLIGLVGAIPIAALGLRPLGP